MQRTARPISWLHANFKQPLRVEHLAKTAHMGVSTLHHQFHALTSMSPLQYQKMLRLPTARERMLINGVDAITAAYEVGYVSIARLALNTAAASSSADPEHPRAQVQWPHDRGEGRMIKSLIRYRILGKNLIGPEKWDEQVLRRRSRLFP